MAGLFTLDDNGLGVLDVNALGGPGTGFVVGSVTAAGSATGAVGFVGSVSNSVTASGSVTGAEGNTGTVAGSVTASGSVTGRAGFNGSVAASVTTTGAGTGSPSLNGSSVSTAVTGGSVSGAPGLSGSITGTATTSGTVTGSKEPGPEPPPPPPVDESGGSARWWYYPKELERKHGRVLSRRLRTNGGLVGTGSRTGAAISVQMSEGFVSGLAQIVIPVLIPPRDSVAERQAAEDELLLMWMDS